MRNACPFTQQKGSGKSWSRRSKKRRGKKPSRILPLGAPQTGVGLFMKARCYRKAKGQPYTRKKYIRGSPPPKITRFTMGDPTGRFEYRAFLIAQKAAQVRHNALEAARIATNRFLSDKLGNNYCLQILPYPHVVLRENKMIFGPHADRLQDGMRLSFGKPVGTAHGWKQTKRWWSSE